MKFQLYMLLLLLVFAGVSAYELERRGLLTREVLDRFIEARMSAKETKMLPVEPVGLAASVRERAQQLREDAYGLRTLNARLEAQRGELKAERALIEARIKELKTESEAASEGKPTAEMALLVKMYENMQPEQAAAVMDDLPGQTVARMLLHMRGRQAGQIMGALKTDKAAEVSKLLSTEDATKKLPKPDTVGAPR